MLGSQAGQNIEQTRRPLAGPRIMFLSALKSRCMGNMTQKEHVIGRERLPYVSSDRVRHFNPIKMYQVEKQKENGRGGAKMGQEEDGRRKHSK